MLASEITVEQYVWPRFPGDRNLQLTLQDMSEVYENTDLKLTIMFSYLSNMAYQQQNIAEMMFGHLKQIAALTGYTDLPDALPVVDGNGGITNELHEAVKALLDAEAERMRLALPPPQPDVPQ